jgi:hypothetical protein
MPSLDDGTGAYSRPQVVTRGNSTVHTFRAIPRPRRFGLFVAAADDTKLLQREVSVAGQDVVIRAWPDDRRWSRFVTRQVRRGLPALAELVGRPARDQQSIYVRESARPGLEGYSGWYDYESGVIEVGEQLDPAVTLHELAHGWFNDDTSFHRWITEGLAEAYANVVIERNGGTPREPERPRPGTPGRQPLNEWEDFDFSRQDQDTETYGYAASYFVIDALLDEIGIERMATVLNAVDQAAAVYADGEPARPGPVGWRRFLDLLEEVGGSERATQLFQRFVVLPAETGELDTRAEARQQVRGLRRRDRRVGAAGGCRQRDGAVGVRRRRRAHGRRRGRPRRPRRLHRGGGRDRCRAPSRAADPLRGGHVARRPRSRR